MGTNLKESKDTLELTGIQSQNTWCFKSHLKISYKSYLAKVEEATVLIQTALWTLEKCETSWRNGNRFLSTVKLKDTYRMHEKEFQLISQRISAKYKRKQINDINILENAFKKGMQNSPKRQKSSKGTNSKEWSNSPNRWNENTMKSRHHAAEKVMEKSFEFLDEDRTSKLTQFKKEKMKYNGETPWGL